MPQRVLGAEPPRTLASASVFVSVLQELRESSEAVRISRETLEVTRRVLGAEPPSTLASASNLASVLQEGGEWREPRGSPAGPGGGRPGPAVAGHGQPWPALAGHGRPCVHV